MDEKVVESPVRATSFAKGLSNRRSRRVGPFYDAMENSEQQQQQQQRRQITPSSITPSTPGGRISEADIERRAQELVDEAHGGIEEGEEERVNEGEEVFDDDEVADAEAEEQSKDEQLVEEDEEKEELMRSSRVKKSRGLTDRISDTVRRAFGYADPGEEFLEEASEDIQEEEMEEETEQAQREQQRSFRNGRRSGNINSKKKGSSSSSSSPSASTTGTTTSKERRQQEKRGSAATTASIATDEKTKKSSSFENASTKQSSKSNNKDDNTEPVDTFAARMKAAKKLKEVKEGVTATKSWNSAGEAHQMKFKPGQKLIVQEDGSFAFADEDDFNSKDSDAGLQKRNEETSKVLRSLSEEQDVVVVVERRD